MQSLVNLHNRRTWAKPAVVLLTITIIIVALASMTTSAPGITYGDVNQDGSIDVRDVVLVMQYIIGLRNLTDDQLEAADVNRDGEVNVQDVTMIMRHILNIETIGKAIKSVEEVQINVFVNNPFERLYFPSKVIATLEDDTTKEINVKWDETSDPPYIKEEKGEYVFEGDLVDIPWGVTNPEGIRARAVVNVLIFDPSFPYPRPDFDQFRLFLVVNPEGSGVVSGSGIYQESETVQVRVTEEAPGFEFINWTWNGDEISDEMDFEFTMPGEDVLLTANFESTWPIQMLGLPIISYVDLGDFYAVTIVIKDEYVDRIESVTILGKSANQDPNNPARWRATFGDEVTLDQLRGQIIINEFDPDELNVVDLEQSMALFVDILGNEIAVRVYLKANETATGVTADGVSLNYNDSEDRWQRTLFGYEVGDTVEVVVTTADGQQTVELEVKEIP